MIAFSHLGKYGKLGNQLFQIAVVYSHCTRNGKEFIFPEWKYNSYLKTPIRTGSIPPGLILHREKDPFSFTPIPNIDNIDLIGYFQNENYFNGEEDTIRDLLEPADFVKSKIEEINLEGITAIHVRRGDYLNFPLHHPIPPMDYYNRSIENLKDKGNEIFHLLAYSISYENLNSSLVQSLLDKISFFLLNRLKFLLIKFIFRIENIKLGLLHLHLILHQIEIILRLNL